MASGETYGAFSAHAIPVTISRGRMLDSPTLILGLVLDDLVLAAALWLAIPRRPWSGVGAWCGSLGMQALALTLLGLRSGGGIALAVSVVAVNAAVALGLTLQLSSLSAFYRRPFARPWHLAAALGCGLVGGALASHPSARIAAVSLIYAGGMTAIGLCARRWQGKNPGRGARWVAYGSLAGAGVMLLRAVAALIWPDRVGNPHAGLVPVLSGFAGQAITLATSLGFLLMHRERQEQEIERLAMTDSLTGVYNRRTLFDLGEKEMLRARRTGASLSLVILDVDHFKKINDKYGHLGGDAVLLRFVEVVRGCLRLSDVLTRYGGEEFCILLPGVGRAGARVVGERIRATIEASTFFVGAVPLRVTSSVGVAELPNDAAATLSSLVARADQALYIAKRDGRNRVSVAAAA
jgi:diguanylate cyclase (GGDEF)-like protein